MQHENLRNHKRTRTFSSAKFAALASLAPSFLAAIAARAASVSADNDVDILDPTLRLFARLSGLGSDADSEPLASGTIGIAAPPLQSRAGLRASSIMIGQEVSCAAAARIGLRAELVPNFRVVRAKDAANVSLLRFR